MTECKLCGRTLKPAEECEPDDPAMDCGGDCWGCVGPTEEELRQLSKLPNAIDAGDLLPAKRVTPDGTEW